MSDFKLTTDIILMLLPLAVIQFGLALYCIIKIVREGVENLNKLIWILICLLINPIGPITFLIIGRKRDLV